MTKINENTEIREWESIKQTLSSITNGETLVKDLDDGTLYRINISLLAGATESVHQWMNNDPEYPTGYPLDFILEYDSKLWKSKITDNLNNPPSDGSVYWEEVSKATGNVISRYVVGGVYTINPTVVIKDDLLYVLADSVTLPFESNDFGSELESGIWVNSAGENTDIIKKNDRKLSRGFANGFFHEFGFNVYEDSGILFAEVYSLLEEWEVGTSYTKYNSIFWDGYKYTAISNSTGVQPDTDYTEDPENITATWFRDEPWDGCLRGQLDGTTRTFFLDCAGPGPNEGVIVPLTAGTVDKPLVNYIYGLPIGDTLELQLTSSTTIPIGGVVFAGYAGCFDIASHQGGRIFILLERLMVS